MVPAANAQSTKSAISEAGLFATRFRPVRRAGEVAFPVTDAERARPIAERFGGRVEPGNLPRTDRPRDPHDALRDALADALPGDLLNGIPRKWERVGRVVLVKPLPTALDAYRADVGRALADVLDAKTVLEELGGVAGELREMAATRPLFGSETVTTHREHGVAYRLDAARIMFASGNVEERARMGRVDARGETVADMFAGIGYFALPLAVHAGAARVVAMEKNPVSHRFLAENARLNEVAHVVEPWLGDNRDYPTRAFADRVVMGYFPGTHTFLDTAMGFAKPEGATIHYHDTVWEQELGTLGERVEKAAGKAGFEAQVLDTRVVKGYAPGIVHGVADVRVAK